VAGEAALALSQPRNEFTIYVDNSNGGSTQYTLVNPLPAWPIDASNWNSPVTMTLRDRSGAVMAESGVNLGGGQQLTELVSDRFPQAGPGFEGTVRVSTGTAVTLLRAAAMRIDAGGNVLTALPISIDGQNPETDPGKGREHRTLSRSLAVTLTLPHIADGGGYRSRFVLINSSDAPATATVEFFASGGGPVALPVNGTGTTRHVVQLAPRQVVSVRTDGTSPEIKWGWARVTTNAREYWDTFGGGVILETTTDGQTTSAAGIASASPTSHFASYVESRDGIEAGIAIANPNSRPIDIVFTLRDTTGAALAATRRTIPALGHLAQFVTQLFPEAGPVEGMLEADSIGGASSAVGLRYTSVDRSIFTTLPVSRVP
jgi:hypothetical protein